VINELHLVYGTSIGFLSAEQVRTAFLCAKHRSISPRKLEPWLPVLIRQRHTGVHLVEVHLRMEMVALIELPAKFIGQQLAEGCLPRARNTEQDRNHTEKDAPGKRMTQFRSAENLPIQDYLSADNTPILYIHSPDLPSRTIGGQMGITACFFPGS
jgi:hypothetical protein